MRFTVEYPGDVHGANPEFRQPAVMKAFAQQAESLGFDALALAEHPAPSAKWWQAGGHDTFDPTVALGFFAATTSIIRLMTHLYVLPFRNPYLSAKALTSLDIVSDGRLIAGVGAGYLRSEFAALGADFENRADTFDAHLEALRRIWTHPDQPVMGSTFAAMGRLHLDAPIQKPHPPLWIGGNSAATLRRVTAYGSGWSPVLAPASVAGSVRTATIDGTEAFARVVDELKALLDDAGRASDSVDIQVAVPSVDFSDAAAVRQLEAYVLQMSRAGATWILAHVDATSAGAAESYLANFAEKFALTDQG